MKVEQFTLSRMLVCLTALTLLFAGQASSQTNAVPSSPSFACIKARSEREHLICQSDELATADAKLADKYRAKRALLSSAGAEALKQSQRRWLQFVDKVCALGRGYDTGSPCLAKAISERLDDLEDVGQQAGPFRFYRVDLYAVRTAEDTDTGSYPGFYVSHVSYPQIDNNSSPAIIAWNKANVRTLPVRGMSDDDSADTEEAFEIGYANANFISIRWSTSTYNHGTPHGLGQDSVSNWILQPDLHLATVDDFFDGGTPERSACVATGANCAPASPLHWGPMATKGIAAGPWAKPLQQMFWRALTAKGWSPPESDATNVKAQIDEDVIRPEKWFFTNDGLQTSFDSYEGGCYACNPGTPTVPWSELKTILRKNSPIP